MRKLRVLGVCVALMGIGLVFGGMLNGVNAFANPIQATATSLRAVGSALLAVVPGMGADETQATARSAAQEFSWDGRLEAGDLLEIKGINGAITARGTSGREATVTAEKRARRSNTDDVVIEVVEHSRGVTVCAVYPSRRGDNTCEPGRGGNNSIQNNDVRVHFDIEVPEGVRFIAQTVNGNVEATDIEGFVEATTVNGDVEIDTEAGASATTVNGSIIAALGRGWDEDVEFNTVNGSIEIDLPDDRGAELDASWLNGGLEVDDPLTLEGRIRRHEARGAIGTGGPDLEVKTVNGSIRIH